MGRKLGAYLGMLGAMLSMGSVSAQAPKDSRDVQGNDENAQVQYWYGHQPIHPLSRSQKAKSKRLIASNKRQGRTK
jgi:hypothetical protein